MKGKTYNVKMSLVLIDDIHETQTSKKKKVGVKI